MVTLHVKFIVDGYEKTMHDTANECLEYLKFTFPDETRGCRTLDKCIDKINDFGFALVEKVPYKPSENQNFLPEGYQTQEADLDPRDTEKDNG